MKKFKKLICIILVVSMVTSFMLACASEDPPSGNQAPTAEQEETPATGDADAADEETGDDAGDDAVVDTPQDDVALRFSWWGGDARHEATIAAINLYVERNPHVRVEKEYSGFDGYFQRLAVQLAGGTAPDIIQVDAGTLTEYAPQSDFFVDLNEHLNLIDVSGFDQELLYDFGYFEGRLIALPTGLNGISFLVNQQVLDEAGVEFPEQITWEDIITQGRKVNEHNPDNFMINMDRGVVYFVTRIYLYQLSGSFLVTDDLEIAFTREELLEAFNFTLRMYDENIIIPLEESLLFQGSPQDVPGWNNNRFGGWFNWASTATLQDWGEYAVALPYPVMENARQTANFVRPAQMLTIPLTSDNIEAAVSFMDFFFNDPDAAMLLTDTRAIPPVTSNRDLLSEMGLISQIVVDSVNLALANVGPIENDASNNSQIEGIFESVFERLVFRQISPEDAVEETFMLMEDVLSSLRAAD